MNILYEDNHIIIVNKSAGEIVQGDKPAISHFQILLRVFEKIQ